MFRTLLIMLLVLAGTAAAACGGDDNGYGSSTSTPTKAAAGAATTTSAATTAPAQATSAATTAPAASVKIATSAKLGQVLTDAAGMTLYTYDKDTAGTTTSACTGGCATAWPAASVTGSPVSPAGLTGALSTVTRDDGSKQLSYAGKPLYRYGGDKAAGDTTGDGVGGVWHAAKPSGTGASTTADTSSGTSYGY